MGDITGHIARVAQESYDCAVLIDCRRRIPPCRRQLALADLDRLAVFPEHSVFGGPPSHSLIAFARNTDCLAALGGPRYITVRPAERAQIEDSPKQPSYSVLALPVG